MKRIVIEVEEEFHQELKEKAVKQKRSLQSIVYEALDFWNGKYGKIRHLSSVQKSSNQKT